MLLKTPSPLYLKRQKASFHFSSTAPPSLSSQHSSDCPLSWWTKHQTIIELFIFTSSFACCHAAVWANLSSYTPGLLCSFIFFRLPGLGHLNDAGAALSLYALQNAIYCTYTLWHAAQPAWCDTVADSPASSRHLIYNPVTASNPAVVVVLLLHQRAVVLSLQSSSSASCCWPYWGVCSTSSTKRARSVADPASKTCKYSESHLVLEGKDVKCLNPLRPSINCSEHQVKMKMHCFKDWLPLYCYRGYRPLS